MQLNKDPLSTKSVRGWIFDLYPSTLGKVAVWIIAENGERFCFTDSFKRQIYVSGKEADIERFASRLFTSRNVASWNFVHKYTNPRDNEKSKVLEVVLKDCRTALSFTRKVLKSGSYLLYQVHNCDLRDEQAYLYDHHLFPLALVELEVKKEGLKYRLLDSVESVDYKIPPLRIMKIDVEIDKKGKIANVKDPIDKIVVSQEDHYIVVDSGDEKEKLLYLVEAVKKLDPDIILTRGGDSYLLPYITQRAMINNVQNQIVLSRDGVPLLARKIRGRAFFSYGRTYYRAPTRRLFGRVHIDESNTFILKECGIDGLIEIARTCRVPLHRASRSSIGSSMSSLQFYQATKDDYLIPRNKSIPEAFKSTYELLVGDRGGFVYEPKIGIHDDVGEVDFVSMYPSLMANYNISAETILCKCCPDSRLRIPELGYNLCEKRIGIVPKALKPVIAKRILYKRLMAATHDSNMKEIYDNRQRALKWILVTCFGYLGYRNAKFGTVDGHIGVCALGREVFLKASRIAESLGFQIVHGIIDSLWLKKENTTTQEYLDLCRKISKQTNVTLNFEGLYKWIVFAPSKMHPRVGVLNLYYGVMENGRIKVRGIEARRRDTPKLVYDAQMGMINVFAEANNSKDFLQKIPESLKVIRKYRHKLLAGEISIEDLIITKRLSKNPKRYKQRVSQVIAAEQLIKEGAKVSAGKDVRYLFVSVNHKRYDRRVKAEELIEKNTTSDIRKYLLLLYTAAANILSPFGYTAEDVYDAVRGYSCTKLTEF